MQHLHSYGSGFLFLTIFFVLPYDFLMRGGIYHFSIPWIYISFLMATLLPPVLRERAGRLLHTEKQTT